MIDPLSNVPSSRPTTVMTGTSALRSTCRHSTVLFAETLGARGAHIVLAHDFEHGGARHPHDEPHHPGAERDRRHDDVFDAVPGGLHVAGEQALDDVEAGLGPLGDAIGAAAGDGSQLK